MGNGRSERELIRLAEVRALTGWTGEYVRKLSKAGVLKTEQPYEGAWPWYHRSQILEMIKPVGNSKHQ